MELHIPLHEASKARHVFGAQANDMLAPESLDAWGIYHLGLQHMYRFNRVDNDIAAMHFKRASEPGRLTRTFRAPLRRDHFSRAFAARSFTTFKRRF